MENKSFEELLYVCSIPKTYFCCGGFDTSVTRQLFEKNSPTHFFIKFIQFLFVNFWAADNFLKMPLCSKQLPQRRNKANLVALLDTVMTYVFIIMEP
jgi:hypothetical protein